MQATTENPELLDLFEDLYRDYYRDAIGELAGKYPNDQEALTIDWRDVYRFDPALADDILAEPDQLLEYAEEALRQYDLPIDTGDWTPAVRVQNLDDAHTFHPGEFSPTEHAGTYRTIRGDVLVSTEPYSKIEEAAFECQRCGTLNRVPQAGHGWQEPHECQGCERQGPYQVNHDRSVFVDGQTIQLQTPPEVAAGEGRTMQVFVEGGLCGQVSMGDRIAVSGTLHLNQQTSGTQKTGKFEPYLDGRHIEIEEATQADLDIDPDTRERVEALAAGAEGEPLDAAAESFTTEVYGHLPEKKALVLAIVGGATNDPDLRGKFHVLFIGDPSTGKSKLINRVDDVAVRSLSVSSSDATSAGLTSTATQGEFSDGRWTLSPGAFVKANEGVVVIDELDDMSPDHRKSMSEPMANQQINVSKAGINATLSTRTSVVAAANPKHGRFDPYEPFDRQFGFESNIISRFDLVFTFRDQPDPDDDAAVADHLTRHRDATIRANRGEDVPDHQADVIDKPVGDDTLRAWLALANQQPDPVYKDEAVREELVDSFVSLRGANGYDDMDEVPVTFRKLPGVERIARAAAKLEFSPVIEQRHAEQAMALVGRSMQDYQTTEDGTLDADIAETGTSRSQQERYRLVEQTIADCHDDSGQAHIDDVYEALRSDGLDDGQIDHAIEHLYNKGEVIKPATDRIRRVGA